MKIYVIPTGWDRELVLKTVFKSGADRVCLVSAYPKKSHTYSRSDTITQSVTRELVRELSKFTEVDVLEANYIDFNDVVAQVNAYLRKNAGSEFVINMSTGSRLVAATLMFVACVRGIPLEYSVAENHNPKIMELIEKGHDYHCGFTGVLQVPTIPVFFSFSPKELAFIKRVKQSGSLTVSEFVRGVSGNQENRLRSEFHYLCKKLEAQGIVKTMVQGKKVSIRLTHFGQLASEH
ncbi:hypothetical protein HY489_03060 [Candidatus Woesearchaeota archaeon]|nr:hypothetical protein [Candidatus Woesearchaeota archaeon]